jgi:putative ABC transport system permease protein
MGDGRRLVGSVVSAGLAVMLILLLSGLWSGIREQTTLYTDHAGAALYVLQPGVRDLTAGTSVVPLDVLDRVRADPEVTWAAPVRSSYVILQLHDSKVAPYVVGAVPGQPGGVWSLAAGRVPMADDEIVPDRVLARRHGLGIGSSVELAGRRFRVVGLADHSAGFMVPFVFVTHAALDDVTGTKASTSFILIGTSHPTTVAARLQAAGLNVLTRQQVAANNLRLATGIYGAPLRLMVAIAVGAGTLIVALAGYTAIVERQREYGVIKALGGSGGRLIRLAFVQSLSLGSLALATGGLLFLAGRALIETVRPQFEIPLTGESFGTAALASLAMALVATALPARRLRSLEPALAFRAAG